MRVKALSKFFTNLIASRHIKRGKNSLPVDAPGFEESAHLPSFNECRETSACLQAFFKKCMGRIDQKRQKITSL